MHIYGINPLHLHSISYGNAAPSVTSHWPSLLVLHNYTLCTVHFKNIQLSLVRDRSFSFTVRNSICADVLCSKKSKGHTSTTLIPDPSQDIW